MRAMRAGTVRKGARSKAGRSKNYSRKAESRYRARSATSGRHGRHRAGLVSRFLNYMRGAPLIGRPMLLLTAVLLLGVATAGIYAGGYIGGGLEAIGRNTQAAFAAAGFRVERITLNGNERTAAGEVYGALGFDVGDSIFAADPETARASLRALPWVADAEVRRRFPDRLEVRLFEKRPFALWQRGDAMVVVERSGAVIAGAEPSAFTRLPFLIGTGAPEVAAPLIDALGGQRALGARLRGIERISERRWDLILAPGVRVRLPEEGWADQLGVLEGLIVDRGILERDVEMIDLRFPDSYIFQLHNGDSRPVSRERPV